MNKVSSICLRALGNDHDVSENYDKVGVQYVQIFSRLSKKRDKLNEKEEMLARGTIFIKSI